MGSSFEVDEVDGPAPDPTPVPRTTCSGPPWSAAPPPSSPDPLRSVAARTKQALSPPEVMPKCAAWVEAPCRRTPPFATRRRTPPFATGVLESPPPRGPPQPWGQLRMLADFHAPQPTAPVNRGQASRSTRLTDPRRTQPRCPERTCPGPPRSAAPQLPGSAPVGRGPHKAGPCRPLGSCRSVRRGLRPPAVARRPSRPGVLESPPPRGPPPTLGPAAHAR